MDNPARILVLEDNPADAELAQRELRKAGIRFVAEVATNEASFIRCLESCAPDLVLSDFSLPGFDGLAAMALARKRFPGIPVIIVSGAIGEETAIDVMKAGATDYVLKQRLHRLVPATQRALQEAQEHERRRRAEAALRESESRFRGTFENAAVGIAHLDRDGRFLRANQKLQEILDRRWDALNGRWFADFTHPEDREADLGKFAVLMRGEIESYTLEKRYLHPDGGVVWAQVTRSLQRDEAGKPAWSISIVQDITERKQAEEAQARLAAIVEFSDDAILSKTLDGVIRSWNGGAERMFGYRAEEVIGKPITLLIPPDRIAEEQEILSRLRRGDRVSHYETIRVAKDGRKIPVLVTISPVRDRDGRIISASKIIHDITGLKRAEAELRYSEQKFAAAFANNPAAVTLARLKDGQFLEVNNTWLDLTGYSRQDVADGTVEPSAVWALPDARARFLQELREKGSVHGWEQELRKKSGEIFVAQIAAQVLHLGGEDVVLATLVDITRRKRAEEQVRMQIGAMEAAANGMAITDAKGTILWANRAFVELTGYSVQELIGQNHRILKSGEQDAVFYRKLWETILRGEIWRGELVNRRKDGTLYSEEQTIAPLMDAEGRITHFVAIKQDISTRKAVEQALAAAKLSADRAKAAAEEASKAKDQFLAVLSHELRTPLTPVVAAVSMLQEGVVDEQMARDALEMIRRNVEMEARLIDDLLDVTRIVRGKIELQRRPVMLCEIIRGAWEVCKPDIEARQIQVGLDLGRSAPYLIEADPTRLQQVFWNLLKNAVKFTPRGGSIGIHCHRENDHVIAEVRDSGEGIEPHLLPSIFNPFEQGGARVTRQFGGLGLGLTITKGVVELHGGTIEAYSAGKGKGATFRIRLPLCVTCELVPAETQIAETAAHGETAFTHKLRILLVEDHGDTAKVMRRLLCARGYEVETAGDVASALTAVEQGSFDLLLSDLGLPDGSGMDLMRKLREHGRTLPGIALSGYGREEDILRSKEAGFAAHLTKPTNPDVLTRLIGAVIHAGAAR